MTTTNKSIHRATITLGIPGKIADLILYGTDVVQKLTNNPSFPSARPPTPRPVGEGPVRAGRFRAPRPAPAPPRAASSPPPGRPAACAPRRRRPSARGRRSPASRASCRARRDPSRSSSVSRSMRASSSSFVTRPLSPTSTSIGPAALGHDAHRGPRLRARRRSPRTPDRPWSSRAGGSPRRARAGARRPAGSSERSARGTSAFLSMSCSLRTVRAAEMTSWSRSPSRASTSASSAAFSSSRRRVRAERDARLARRRPRHALPQLLGDERHERVQQAQAAPRARTRASPASRPPRRARYVPSGACAETGFDELEVPVAEVVPEEAVEPRSPPRRCGTRRCPRAPRRSAAREAREDPAVVEARRRRGRVGVHARVPRGSSSERRVAFQILLTKWRLPSMRLGASAMRLLLGG